MYVEALKVTEKLINYQVRTKEKKKMEGVFELTIYITCFGKNCIDILQSH